MKISEVFNSKFLAADDLDGKAAIVTIETVDVEEIGKNKDKKLVLKFKGKDKRLVCNKTNAGTIAKLYGDDTDDWAGRRIKIVPREVEFQGEMVWAIRVSLEKPVAATSRPEPEPEPEVGDDEEIPF